MIGMGVGDDNSIGMKSMDFPEPGFAAIDHNFFVAVRQKSTRMQAVAERLWIDIAARAQKGDFHELQHAKSKIFEQEKAGRRDLPARGEKLETGAD
jgi:hypothetical protein